MHKIGNYYCLLQTNQRIHDGIRLDDEYFILSAGYACTWACVFGLSHSSIADGTVKKENYLKMFAGNTA